MARFIREKQIPCIPVYVDSPMGVEASNAYRKFIDTYDPETLKMIDGQDIFNVCGVKFASSQQESMQINRQAGPLVIIASSPTCEFGRVLHHLKRSVENPDDLIVFCGYIPPNTLGRRIQEGQKRVRIYDRWYDLRCQVRTIHGLSAHADADELMRFLAPALGPQTHGYVVHGEVPQAEAFARRLLRAGVARATIPAMETSLDAYTAPTEATTSQPGHTDQD
jgi:metallo-beta-lactamase family protein